MYEFVLSFVFRGGFLLFCCIPTTLCDIYNKGDLNVFKIKSVFVLL